MGPNAGHLPLACLSPLASPVRQEIFELVANVVQARKDTSETDK
jgi:hypothetical protein